MIKKFHTTQYNYYTHKNFNQLKVVEQNIPYHKNRRFFYPSGADYKILVMGTSPGENVCHFLVYTFKNVFRINNYDVKKIDTDEMLMLKKYYEKDILEYKPDILVLTFSYGNMHILNTLLDMK